MKTIVNAVKNSVQSFVSDEEGSVAVEYALIGSVASIVVASGLGGLATAINAALGVIAAAV